VDYVNIAVVIRPNTLNFHFAHVIMTAASAALACGNPGSSNGAYQYSLFFFAEPPLSGENRKIFG